MIYSVTRIIADDWLAHDSELAHQMSFGELRPRELERIDFALLALKNEKPCGYATCIEMDSETLYWQLGGAFPNTKGKLSAMGAYIHLVDWVGKNYKRLTTRIDNQNVRMLKFALTIGFRVVGTWNFKDRIYLELLLEF